jgi:hypothetical protein
MLVPSAWTEPRSGRHFAGRVLVVLTAVAAAGACRTPPPPRPPDFAIELGRTPGALPPPTREYRIRITSGQSVAGRAAGGGVEIAVVEGDATRVTESFAIDAQDLDELHRELAEAGLFTTPWKDSETPAPAGSGNEYLSVHAAGRDYRLSLYSAAHQDAARVILDTVWAVAPAVARVRRAPLVGVPQPTPPPPIPKDGGARARLLGAHRLSLQWIGWERFGQAVVSDDNGALRLKGEQKSRDGTDALLVDGTITPVDDRSFVFTGTIVVQVSHANGGRPCVRQGEMTFSAKGARQYWRLQQMRSPCGTETDYVDIYFR